VSDLSDLPTIRILRGHECRDDPCSALQEIAAQNYGPSTALPVSFLRTWYEKNASIFRIAVTSDNSVVGYISTLPLRLNMFNRTIYPDFQEMFITAEEIETSLCPSDGGVFLSSIAVAPEYQKRSPASLLLRLALIEDFINECSAENQIVRISAQALSVKGEACMRSLGMKARGFTTTGWRVYYGKLGRSAVYSIQGELQRKIAARFKLAVSL
jgi:ribosomal protein S18 acetylase RimI-like enzyme